MMRISYSMLFAQALATLLLLAACGSHESEDRREYEKTKAQEGKKNLDKLKANEKSRIQNSGESHGGIVGDVQVPGASTNSPDVPATGTDDVAPIDALKTDSCFVDLEVRENSVRGEGEMLLVGKLGRGCDLNRARDVNVFITTTRDIALEERFVCRSYDGNGFDTICRTNDLNLVKDGDFRVPFSVDKDESRKFVLHARLGVTLKSL